MTSQQLASASAPPMQAPCTTAMVGFGVASISAHTSPMARLGWPPSPIAAPAEKCLPLPRRTMTRTALSRPNCSNPSASASSISAL